MGKLDDGSAGTLAGPAAVTQLQRSGRRADAAQSTKAMHMHPLLAGMMQRKACAQVFSRQGARVA